MLLKLIALFTIIPIVEVYLLFKIANLTNGLTTIAIVIFTGILGAYLAKQEGKAVLNRLKYELNQGSLPGNELINGLCILIGGILLITPGLITDFVGFTLVMSFTRQGYVNLITEKFKNMIANGNVNFFWRI